MNMNAVGIDVAKRKSTVAVLRPGGEVVVKPFDIPHLTNDFKSLTSFLHSLEGETRIVMECTGRYYEPVARTLSCLLYTSKHYSQPKCDRINQTYC